MGFIELPALAMEGSDARTRLSMLITALRQIVMLLLAFCVVMALAGRAYESGFGPHADTDSSGTSAGRDAALPGSRRRWAEEGPLIGLAAPRWGGRPAQQWQPAVPLQMRPSKWRRVPHWPPAAPPRPPPRPPKAPRPPAPPPRPHSWLEGYLDCDCSWLVDGAASCQGEARGEQSYSLLGVQARPSPAAWGVCRSPSPECA